MRAPAIMRSGSFLGAFGFLGRLRLRVAPGVAPGMIRLTSDAPPVTLSGTPAGADAATAPDDGGVSSRRASSVLGSSSSVSHPNRLEPDLLSVMPLPHSPPS